MNNPFESIMNELNEIKQMVAVQRTTEAAPEIIDRKELQKRLKVSEPTIISWDKKKKIPCFRIGSAIRYDWNKVLKALEK
jgi:hypothetical protein